MWGRDDVMQSVFMQTRQACGGATPGIDAAASKLGAKRGGESRERGSTEYPEKPVAFLEGLPEVRETQKKSEEMHKRHMVDSDSFVARIPTMLRLCSPGCPFRRDRRHPRPKVVAWNRRSGIADGRLGRRTIPLKSGPA